MLAIKLNENKVLILKYLTCPSDSVHIFFNVTREVVVEHVADVSHIDTPAKIFIKGYFYTPQIKYPVILS